MGIYIKGMEMPFTCLNCNFHKCAGGVGDFCSLTKRRQFRFKNRPKDCPLIEVPEPHGRLINVDKVLDALAHNLGIRSLDYLTPGERAIVSWFRDAPTVIPEEKGE